MGPLGDAEIDLEVSRYNRREFPSLSFAHETKNQTRYIFHEPLATTVQVKQSIIRTLPDIWTTERMQQNYKDAWTSTKILTCLSFS